MEKIKRGELEDRLKSSEYVILDFSSPGCAPCAKVPPFLEEIIEEKKGVHISVYEVDVAEEPEIAQNYFILGVPTIIVFKNGQEIKRFNSIPPKKKITKIFE